MAFFDVFSFHRLPLLLTPIGTLCVEMTLARRMELPGTTLHDKLHRRVPAVT